jgi:hypothetical protein
MDHIPRPSIPLDQATPLTAQQVARGVQRLFWNLGWASLTEFTLGCGRRVDVAALNQNGFLHHVEIKVSLADLRGDRKWPDYLDYCDVFSFAAPVGLPLGAFDAPALLPERCGLIVSDGLTAAVIRAPSHAPLSAARRKAETLRFARKAAERHQQTLDPWLRQDAAS